MIDIDSLVEEAIKITNRPDVLEFTFEQQLAFIKDPARLKTLFCTRRAAKSYTAGVYMIDECLKRPGINCLFVGLTRASAEGIVWKDILKVIDRERELGIRFNEQKLTATFPNGSVIYVTGVDVDEDEMNKLLGKKYRLVCIDEASMYTINMQKLVYGVLKPAMADQQGTICLMGTSSNFTRGLFFDITTGKEAGWSLHQWSAHDNPFIAKQWAEELEDIRLNRPLFMDTPLFKQWYLNQWVVDTDKLVYKFNVDRDLYDVRPQNLNPSGWTYVLGVDTGWEDDNAFVLVAFHENDPKLYVIDTFNKPKMTFDEVVLKINEYMSDTEWAPSKVIIDGANKQGVETMKVRSNIPFEYAEKQAKVDYIEILNADLIQEKVKIHKSNHNLINELMSLVWKTDGDKIVIPKKEHPALPNHLCDAFLYAWRNGYHYHSTEIKKPLVVGSREWYQSQSEDIWEHERDSIEKQQGNNAWPSDDSGWPNQ